jgi:hypothetical protein
VETLADDRDHGRNRLWISHRNKVCWSSRIAAFLPCGSLRLEVPPSPLTLGKSCWARVLQKVSCKILMSKILEVKILGRKNLGRLRALSAHCVGLDHDR